MDDGTITYHAQRIKLNLNQLKDEFGMVSHEQGAIINDLLERFQLWAGDLGALHPADQPMSLDSRVSSYPEVREQIVTHLDDLEQAVRDLRQSRTSTHRNLGKRVASKFHSLTDHGASDPGSGDFQILTNIMSQSLGFLFRIAKLTRKVELNQGWNTKALKHEALFARQDAQGTDERRATGNPILADDPISHGDSASDLEANQKKPVTLVSSYRSEEESAAKTTLQDAARKLRDLAARASYDIVDDIQDIEKLIAELMEDQGWKQPKPTSDMLDRGYRYAGRRIHPQKRKLFDVERWRPCEVQRASMEYWPPKDSPHYSDTNEDEDGDSYGGLSAPHFERAPVLQVFYRSIPPTLPNPDSIVSEVDFKDAHSTSHEREKPERVLIHSTVLIKDLESICGLKLPNRPHVMIPPFKLLVHNWFGIHDALTSMEYKHKAMLAEDQNTTIPKPGPSDNRAEGVQDTQFKRDIQTERYSRNNPEDVAKVAREKLSLRIMHLKLLVDFIKTDLGHLIGLRMKIQDSSLTSITFEELYYLCAPGDLIINREASVDHLHQVYAVTGGRVRLGGHSIYRDIEDEVDDSPGAGVGTWTDVVIDCFRMRWDGTHIGPVRLTHRVRHYVGERNITDLDFYPVRFRGNHIDICNALEARGKRVVDLDGHLKYEGVTVEDTGLQPDLKPDHGETGHGEPPALTYESIARASRGGQEINGDVYVDMKTYYQTINPLSRVFDKLRRAQPSAREVTEDRFLFRPGFTYHEGDHDVDEARSDAFMNKNFHLINPKIPEELTGKPSCLSLLSHAVPAYEFRSREWIWVDVTKVEPIDKSDETRKRGWEDLVIDNKYRRLLESLVNNHMSPAEQKRTQSQIGESTPTAQIDPIQCKGQGLIILLHGPPGTGKTSTAEAIAAYTGKPLYAITCGDIGLNPEKVEANLLKHTRLAEKWGCVLLLDKADVFLARRGWNKVNRNALVSAFLRRLEYYSGILFLTTNIVGLIDEAFKSRIHVALRYDKINDATTERIWQNLLRRIDRDNQDSNVKIRFDESELLDFAMEHYDEHAKDESTWNARQIRNAFSTAIAMGQFDRLERIREEGVSPEEALTSGNKSLKTIRLTKSNFRKIANIGDDFEQYISAVRGDDAENAQMNQQRDDFFGQQRMPPRKKYNLPAYDDDDYVVSSGKRRGYQSSSHPSRSALKGKSASKKHSNRDEADEEESEVDEDQHDSDVRSRRMRRSRKVPSDDEGDRWDKE